VRFGDSGRTEGVNWGRRAHAVAFLRHRYGRSGRYTIKVRARDVAGNSLNIAIRVNVP
jgi:hypothetical protein